MARRPPVVHKPARHTDETRSRIAAARVIDRLQNFVLGDNPDAMSPTQVTAAVALLNKVIPNLQSVETKSEETTIYVLRAPSPAQDAKEWLNNYVPKTIEHVPDKPKGKAN